MAELNTLATLLADANLKGYYRMESGALTTDTSGESHTLTSASAGETTGKYGGGTALSNGVRLYRGDNYEIAGNGDSSIAFWTKRSGEIESGSENFYGLLTSLTAESAHQVWYEYNSGTPKFVVYCGAVVASFEYSLGTDWHHIVIVRSSGSNYTKLYIDNSLVDTGTFGSQATSGQTNFNLSGDGQGTNGYTGAFDDVCLFNRVITVDEIGELFAPTVTTNHLKYYRRTRFPGNITGI